MTGCLATHLGRLHFELIDLVCLFSYKNSCFSSIGESNLKNSQICECNTILFSLASCCHVSILRFLNFWLGISFYCCSHSSLHHLSSFYYFVSFLLPPSLSLTHSPPLSLFLSSSDLLFSDLQKFLKCSALRKRAKLGTAEIIYWYCQNQKYNGWRIKHESGLRPIVWIKLVDNMRMVATFSLFSTSLFEKRETLNRGGEWTMRRSFIFFHQFTGDVVGRFGVPQGCLVACMYVSQCLGHWKRMQFLPISLTVAIWIVSFKHLPKKFAISFLHYNRINFRYIFDVTTRFTLNNSMGVLYICAVYMRFLNVCVCMVVCVLVV